MVANIHSFQRSRLDRRRSEERRELYSIDYFATGGLERRRDLFERRSVCVERRSGWVRVGRWCSIRIEFEPTDASPPRQSIPSAAGDPNAV